MSVEREFCPGCKKEKCLSNCEEQIKQYNQDQIPHIDNYELEPGHVVTLADDTRVIIIAKEIYFKYHLGIKSTITFGSRMDLIPWLIVKVDWNYKSGPWVYTCKLYLRRINDFRTVSGENIRPGYIGYIQDLGL